MHHLHLSDQVVIMHANVEMRNDHDHDHQNDDQNDHGNGNESDVRNERNGDGRNDHENRNVIDVFSLSIANDVVWMIHDLWIWNVIVTVNDVNVTNDENVNVDHDSHNVYLILIFFQHNVILWDLSFQLVPDLFYIHYMMYDVQNSCYDNQNIPNPSLEFVVLLQLLVDDQNVLDDDHDDVENDHLWELLDLNWQQAFQMEQYDHDEANQNENENENEKQMVFLSVLRLPLCPFSMLLLSWEMVIVMNDVVMGYVMDGAMVNVNDVLERQNDHDQGNDHEMVNET